VSDDAALAGVLNGLAEAFEPLVDALESPEGLAAFLSEMGWAIDAAEFTGALVAFGELPDAARRLLTAAGQLSDAIDSGGRDAIITAVQTALPAVQALAAATQALTRPLATADLPALLQSEEFWTAFPVEVLDFLLYRYLQRRMPALFAPLRLLGILRPVPTAASDPRSGDRLLVDWAALPALLADPTGTPARMYRWGTAFDHVGFLKALAEASYAAGLPTVPRPVDPDALALYWDPVAPGNPSSGVDPSTLGEIQVPLWWGMTADATTLASAQFSLVVMPIPPTGDRTSAPVGFAVFPELSGTVAGKQQLADGVDLEVSGGASAAGGVRIEFRPGSVGATLGVAGHADARVAVRGHPATAWILLGADDGTRLELAAGHLALALRVGTDGTVEVAVEAGADTASLVLEPGDLDGFLGSVLGDKAYRLDMSMVFGWSSRSGVTLGGGLGLTAQIPVDTTIAGAITIDTVDITLRGDLATRRARLVVTIAAELEIGPFSAVVEGVGVALELGAPADGQPGTMGPVDLALGFKPPTGVGLAIDAPAVSGGGFLFFDDDAGRYAGVFELTIMDVVSVKAIALITTKLPDGSAGFALLIMITAEGFTPIQLGMGFSLTGIGGLLALNRTVDADAVRGGLQDGVLDSILFVKDPVRNANRIIATLDKVFPLAADRLVIGPLAEISWGSPAPLVKLRIALLLEVPQPIRAILLAALSVVLPREKEAVVELHVDAIGVLDLGRGELALDASLHHSRLLTFSLTGDMALRLNWGSDPMFLLSIGGFHPKFTPPRGLRPLQRLALTLTDGANPRVRFEAYLALTSNTVQMGARVSVFAEVGGFGIDGGGSFDTLIQWSPFALEVAFAAWLRVFSSAGTLLAISVALNVTGPTPWHVTGKASVQVLFFSISVGIDLYLGATAEPEPVATVDVAAALWEEVSDPRSWHAVLPASTRPGATLAPPEQSGAAAAAMVAHPLAVISMRQKVVPLGVPVSRVGAAVPTQGTRAYALDVGGPAGMMIGVVDDLFAPAQYTDVPDDVRLAGPSFARLPAGVSMHAANASDAGPGLGCDLAFETLDVHDLDQPANLGAPVAAEAGTAITPLADPVRPRPLREIAGTQGMSPWE
jgi:hypothetical protein